MDSRSEILSRIRRAGPCRPSGDPGRPDPLFVRPDRVDAAEQREEAEAGRASTKDALAEAFARECEALSVKVHGVQSHETATDLIGSLIRDREVQKILHWRTPLLERLGIHELIRRLEIESLESAGHGPDAPGAGFTPEEAQLGITGADYGLADSGTLVIRHGPGRDRTPSVLPPVHVAVLEKNRILPDLDALMMRLRADLAAGKAPDRCITLISGPSKTADIGISLVLGIHGPSEVHVVLLDIS